MNAQLIEHSLEMVVERVGDPGQLIYQRLFAQMPDLEALFVRDTDGSVRGEMLQRAFETLLDLANDGHYAKGLIATEFVNHQNLGVPADQFELFFKVIVDSIRQVLAEHWSAEIEAAWSSLAKRIDEVIHP